MYNITSAYANSSANGNPIILAYVNSYCKHSAILHKNWLKHSGHLMAYEKYTPNGYWPNGNKRYDRSIGYSAFMYNY